MAEGEEAGGSSLDRLLLPPHGLAQGGEGDLELLAGRIDPAHDIWAAADPVVRRWITRELSPAAKVRDFVEEEPWKAVAIAGVSLVVLIIAVLYSKRDTEILFEPEVPEHELASH